MKPNFIDEALPIFRFGKNLKAQDHATDGPKATKEQRMPLQLNLFFKQKVMIDMIIEEHAGSRKTLTFIQRMVNDAADMPDERPFHAM